MSSLEYALNVDVYILGSFLSEKEKHAEILKVETKHPVQYWQVSFDFGHHRLDRSGML